MRLISQFIVFEQLNSSLTSQMISLRFIVVIGMSLVCQEWAAAQTLGLGQLIQRAINSHPSIRSQQSNEKSAQLGIETAQYQKYPTPQLSLESVKKNSHDPTYVGGDGVATIRITQPIFNGGQFASQLDKATQTLIVLTMGVLIAMVIEHLMKHARSSLYDLLIDTVDQSLSRSVFMRLLSVRLDQMPARPVIAMGSCESCLKGA